MPKRRQARDWPRAAPCVPLTWVPCLSLGDKPHSRPGFDGKHGVQVRSGEEEEEIRGRRGEKTGTPRASCLFGDLAAPGSKAALEGEPKGCVGEGGGSAIFRGDGERGSCPVCLCLHRMDSRGLRRAPWGRMGRAQRKAGGVAVY